MKEVLPYGKHYVDRGDIKAVSNVLKSDFLVQGPFVNEFEEALCEYTGAKYAVAVSSGTAALHLAVLALDIKKGSEGITTPNTFAASANCLVYAGLEPVFADIKEDTYNIDPIEIEKKITKKTKVIVAVDFAGQAADLREISKLAKKHKISVIEDAAHAVGSKYADGSKVGSCKYSDLTTFSFHPVKTITTGEGGAITTNSKALYERLLLLRSHGITKDSSKLSQNPGPWYYEMQDLGFNYRLSDFQAALGCSQLKKLDKFVKRRREIVDKYNEAFKDLPNIITPYEAPKLRSAFHIYVVQIDFKKIGKTRAQFMGELKALGVGTQVHYIPVIDLPFYQKNYKNKKSDFPQERAYYERCLTLPLYPRMTGKDFDLVINRVSTLLKG